MSDLPLPSGWVRVDVEMAPGPKPGTMVNTQAVTVMPEQTRVTRVHLLDPDLVEARELVVELRAAMHEAIGTGRLAAASAAADEAVERWRRPRPAFSPRD